MGPVGSAMNVVLDMMYLHKFLAFSFSTKSLDLQKVKSFRLAFKMKIVNIGVQCKSQRSFIPVKMHQSRTRNILWPAKLKSERGGLSSLG